MGDPSNLNLFASTLIRKGIELEQVAILLGHSEIDVTADYIQVDKNRLREMYEIAL